MFIITDKAKASRREVNDVSVMKDEELKLEETEASHTYRRCRCYSAVRYTTVNMSQ